MSSEKKCCVPGCSGNSDSGSVLHLFPNPAKDMDRFKLWMFNIGGDILAFNNEYIYKNRRVCHAHFESKYCCRYNRISNIAVPTLNLPALSKLKLTTTSTEVKRPLTAIENVINIMPSTSKACRPLEQNMSIPIPVTHHIAEIEKGMESILPENEISSGMSKQDFIKPKKSGALKKVTFLRSKLTKTELKVYNKLIQAKAKLSKYKNKVKKQTATLKSAKKLFSNESFIKALENMPSTRRLITLMQFRESKKKDKGRRFSEQEKLVSLAIMKQSPKAYRFLRKIFILPKLWGSF